MVDSRAVNVPADIYEGIKARVEVTEFESVDEYVTYVLKQVLEQVGKKEEESAYSKEDEEKVKERLRSLGYLD